MSPVGSASSSPPAASTSPSPSPSSPFPAFSSAKLWIVDLDGVIWLSGDPIGKVAEAVAALRARGARVVFATNNSAPTGEELLARLERLGVTSSKADLVTSAGAAATLVEPGQLVKVLGEAGILEALEARSVTVADGDRADAAIVGWTRSFDFGALAATATVARSTGRLVATNEDPTHPTPAGLMPGAGAILAAVATASGVTPLIAGKPHEPMASLMKSAFRFAAGDASVVMIGDQPRTDGRLAQLLDIPFGLVDSGVTPASADGFDVPVAARFPDFVTMVRALVG
jgi:HAD superfamily hydrolase (TIGR01450 family)